MRNLKTRLIVALLTFVLGIATVTAWLLYLPSNNQEVHIILPNARWEPLFFKEINAVGEFAGLTELRRTRLAEGDVEVRVWWGFGLEPLEGVVLKRVGGQWSATHLKGDCYYKPQKTYRKDLRPPKSGWESYWKQLVDAGILTLPDASEVNCNVGGLDGGSYVVEINKDKTYRTYMYDLPTEAKCNEAKQMVKIGDIMFEEFEFGNSQD